MLANRPIVLFGLFQDQTLGGVYSGVSTIPGAPVLYGRTRTPRAIGSCYTIARPLGTRCALDWIAPSEAAMPNKGACR
jgi:hypothetical protein